ncbi:Ku protein [Xanthobacteraceae bacterium Astr-EGSB]|uniref:non-homologous end joining protein Ku n=1 Tax=Astrobacterium formosum TaxID=3069710 RepID=UPI0027AF5F28|nr:Ku protein [Xanthobacteraceae bacterium Astr-EGSB]
MAPRANWKGYLKLSLVSCAVALFPATTVSNRIRFNIINRKTGHRVHNQVVDAETGEQVPRADRVKGFKVEDDDYILVEEEELDEVALESTHTIEIETFVPRSEVDELYLDESYYIVPEDDIAQEAFAVIREAMRTEEVVGLARLVLHRREHILMLAPRGKGLMATMIRTKKEVRSERTYFRDIEAVKIAPDMLDLARHIVVTKAGHFDPGEFEDRYEEALAALIEAKRTGKSPPSAPSPPSGNVINLMDALRRSVSAERGGKRRSAGTRARKTAAKSPGKRTSRRPSRRRLKKAS